MRSKQICLTLAVMMTALIALYFMGCAATSTTPTQKSPEELKAYQDSLFNVHKRHLQLKWSLGYENFKQKNYDRAKDYFLYVAEKDTSGIFGNSLYQRLGYCYEYTEKPDSALWAYETGVKRIPDNAWLWSRLGEIYDRQGNYDTAVNAYQKSVDNDPENVDYMKALANVLIKTSANDQASEVLSKALGLAPDDKEIQDTLDGLTSNPDDIIDLNLKIIASNPDDLKARMKLAVNYDKIGQFDDAIAQTKYVLDKEPENIPALELMGKIYTSMEKHSLAADTYKNILKIQPDNKKAFCNLSMSYTNLGKYTTALQQVVKALKIDPNYGLAFIAKGFAYETCADRCVESNEKGAKFDDKLVYRLAYNSYLQAKKDLAWKADAENRANYVIQLIPTEADEFMHKGQNQPRGECYTWIQ